MNSKLRRRLPLAVVAVVAGVTVVGMAGCSMVEPTDISRFAAEAPDPDSKVIRLNNVYEPNHPMNRCGTATMKEELAKHDIELKVYPSAQLGSEVETVEQVATGALDIGMSTGAFFSAWYPDSAVVDGAYLLKDGREYDRAMRGPTMTKMFDDMGDETGLQVFSAWYYGARNMTANKPIRVPEDLKGLKLRTPDAPLFVSTIDSLGGTATPMALSELYVGLQQGTIDAEENPITTIDSNKLTEVQSHLSMTKHIVQGIQLVANRDFLDSLTDEEYDALMDASDKARLTELKCVEDEEQATLDKWEHDGSIEIVDDVDIEAFREKVKENLLPKVPWADLYFEVQDELAAGTPTVVGTDPADSPLFADDERSEK